jgi:hypothetical protein
MIAITALPVIGGIGIGYGVLRRYPPVATRVKLGLERVLDFVERGAVKPGHQLPKRPAGLLEALAGEVRRAIAAPPSSTSVDRKDRA